MTPAARAPRLDQARGWWSARSRREQLLLAVLGGIAALALFLILIVRPLQSARTQAAADIRVADMAELRLAGSGPVAASSGTPGDQVAKSAAGAGVQVLRAEAEDGRFRVALADASFEGVLRFVADLERTSPLRVSEARIVRAASGAGVSASFLLAGGR